MSQKKIKLQDKFVEYLETQPEQGMGYQVVDLYLKNGIILQNRIVINSTFLQLETDEDLNTDDIVKIEITTANKL